MLPVIGCWAALRQYVPVFTTAVAHGLVRRPTRRTEPRVSTAPD
jgi:hypothetical protein